MSAKSDSHYSSNAGIDGRGADPPHKYKRRIPTVDTVLSGGRAAATVMREVADMAQFPPARAVANLLLALFDVIEVCWA